MDGFFKTFFHWLQMREAQGNMRPGVNVCSFIIIIVFFKDLTKLARMEAWPLHSSTASSRHSIPESKRQCP